jgi:hypothetical protein
MPDYNESDVIHIIQEKILQNIPSKGRNQWDFIKQFDGKKIGEFVESAKIKTANSDSELFQGGTWWYREISWNLERGNITLK